MYTAVRSSRLYQQIVEQIEKSIRAGQLKPGDQLPAERDLAERFGVSRTAVREAVKALCEKGLVEALPGRGTFVIDATSHVIKQSLDLLVNISTAEGLAHLEDMREIFEPEIAARAATRAEPKHLSAMRDAIADMDRAMHDASAYIEGDLDFHLALAEAAQNPLVLTLIDSIVGLLRVQRTRCFHAPKGPARGQLHHYRILQAVENHDADAARAAMQGHLEQVREDSQAGAASDDSV